jgi:hypothetical protein
MGETVEEGGGEDGFAGKHINVFFHMAGQVRPVFVFGEFFYRGYWVI